MMLRAKTSVRAGAPLAASVSVAVLVAACGVGSGTVRIADAEDTIVAVAEGIVETLGLPVALPIVPSPRETCQLRTGDAGLRARIVLRAPHPDPDAALGAAAPVLVAQGLVIVASGVPGTLLGQRDGLSVTLGTDGRMIELDALTGCRPR
jgi:hypothetical protein